MFGLLCGESRFQETGAKQVQVRAPVSPQVRAPEVEAQFKLDEPLTRRGDGTTRVRAYGLVWFRMSAVIFGPSQFRSGTEVRHVVCKGAV